jgi:hypothetical protein
MYWVYHYRLIWGWGSIDWGLERKKLLNLLRGESPQLSPLSPEDLESVSENPELTTDISGQKTVVKGYCTNIYGDKVIAFAAKSYPAFSSLRVAMTAENIFTFISKNDYTKIYIDDTEAGTVDNQGNLYSPNQRLLASIDTHPNMAGYAIRIYGRKVGNLNTAFAHSVRSGKAFRILERLEKDEYELFLALSMMKITSLIK